MKGIESKATETLAKITPRTVKRALPQALKHRMSPQMRVDFTSLPSYNYLQNLMFNYQTKDLANVDPKSFKEKINEFLEIEDYAMEGWNSAEKQRDLSVKFHWGHNHDFGDFSLKGRMEDRHIRLLAAFIDEFEALPKSLDGLRVLDIGCWTGGTSLLLCAMGAHVVAIEEVKKYIDCLNYLKYAFNMEKIQPMNLSLYECVTADFQDSFDVVLFAGVLYHVTDPILALRITFNCLKDGGACLLETAAIDSKKPTLSYERHRWNWFIPSPATLSQMMADVGYSDIQVSKVIGGRASAVARRDVHVDMVRAGLSVSAIR